MAGAGFKDFEAGDKLFAADVDNYLMQQSVMRFANSAARGSAIGTAIAEGMMSYLDDSNSVEVYNGSAWVGLESTLNDGTQGYTALSNGTAGITYQPVSHNYIINGAFDVWQRGTSFVNPLTGSYTADRFQVTTNTASANTISQQKFTAGELEVASGVGAENYFRFVTTGTDTAPRVLIALEDVRTLAGQTATLSFYAKSATADVINTTSFIQQNFGSGGSAQANTGFTLASSVTSSWARYSVTIAIPSLTGKTIGTGNSVFISMRFKTSTAFTLDIWGVQLEAGSVATPFKRHAPSLQGELAACQRYYYKAESAGGLHLNVGFAGSTTAARYAFQTPVVMRATPSLTSTNLRIGYGGFSSNTPTSIAIQGYIGNSAELRATASSAVLTTGEAILLNTDAILGGSIELSAEL